MKKKHIIVLLILSVLIFFGSLFGMSYFEEMVNNTQGLSEKYDYKDGASNENVEINVQIAETWPKEFPDGFEFDKYFNNSQWAGVSETGKTEGAGRTVEITVNNISEYRINNWYIEYEVPCDMFFDKAWNGTVEIHQFGNKNVDTINTMDMPIADTTLEYVPVDELFLIPLRKGDKIIYHPADFEIPLVESFGEDENSHKTIGLIIYTEDKSFQMNEFKFEYFVVKSLEEYPVYVAMKIMFLIFGVLALVIGVYLFVAIRYENMHRHDRDIISQAIGTFSRFIDSKDKYTNNHSYRVAGYAKLIAEKIGLSEMECEDIYYIGLLHDIGKMEIDDKILNKPGRLTSQEYEVIKSHTTCGADLLKDFTAIKNIAVGALYHHERYDGKGYPSGLAGEDIPLVARIICVADSYDAMSSNRCYRHQLESEEIINQLVINKGKQFDGEIVDIFLECLEKGEVDAVRRSCIEG